MIQDTCVKEKCPFWKIIDSEERPCPNFLRVQYAPAPTNPGDPFWVNECAPIRTMILYRSLSDRLVAVQKGLEEARNEAVWVQVVAEVLGKNVGIDLSSFVEKRRQLMELDKLKQLQESTDKGSGQ